MAQVAFPGFEKAINPLMVKWQKKKNYNQIEEHFIEAKGWFFFFTAGFWFFNLGFLFAYLGLN